MALDKTSIQSIFDQTLSQSDILARFSGFMDFIKFLSLDELDIGFGIINDPKNSVSLKFDAPNTFFDPLQYGLSLPVTATQNSSSLPSLDSLPRPAVIRITMLSLRFDDLTTIQNDKKRDLYLYNIQETYIGRLIYSLPAANATAKTEYYLKPDDRRRQISTIKTCISQLLIDINQFELKTVADMVVAEILESLASEDSVIGELINALFAYGFQKIIGAIVQGISGAAKNMVLQVLTAPNGLINKLMIHTGSGVIFDQTVLYNFLSRNEGTAAEAALHKTLHVITSKNLIDVDAVLKDAEGAIRTQKIQQSDELRGLVIDYVTMLEHGLQAISGRLDLLFKPDGNLDISASSKGYDMVTDDDIAAIYLFILSYDYESMIKTFIDNYNTCIRDIGKKIVNSGSFGMSVTITDYRIATWLVYKGQAHLVYADIPFSIQPKPVRVYYIIPETVSSLAIKKTQLAITSIDDFKEKWPVVFADEQPLIPLDNSFHVNSTDLNRMYSNVFTQRNLVEYPTKTEAK